MDRNTAKYVLDELCEIQATIHRPIPQGLPDLNDAEAARLKRVMGFAIGTIYTDLMMSTIELYPDLDPDLDDTALVTPAVPTETARPTRAEFSQQLLRACELASERLERLHQVVWAQQGESASAAFREKSADAKCHLADLIDFARAIAARHH
jgi:hypothetical protein